MWYFWYLILYHFLWRWAPENDEETRTKKLQNLGYEFHIGQRSWNGHLVTSLFSDKGIPSTPTHTDSDPCTRPPSWGTQRARGNDSRVSWVFGEVIMWKIKVHNLPMDNCVRYRKPYKKVSGSYFYIIQDFGGRISGVRSFRDPRTMGFQTMRLKMAWLIGELMAFRLIKALFG